MDEGFDPRGAHVSSTSTLLLSGSCVSACQLPTGWRVFVVFDNGTTTEKTEVDLGASVEGMPILGHIRNYISLRMGLTNAGNPPIAPEIPAPITKYWGAAYLPESLLLRWRWYGCQWWL